MSRAASVFARSPRMFDDFEEIITAVNNALPDYYLPSREEAEWAFVELSRARDVLRNVVVEMGFDASDYDWSPRTNA